MSLPIEDTILMPEICLRHTSSCVLTRPFDKRSEKFRSTFLIDFLSSGVTGLLYTMIVGPLTRAWPGRLHTPCAQSFLIRSMCMSTRHFSSRRAHSSFCYLQERRGGVSMAFAKAVK